MNITTRVDRLLALMFGIGFMLVIPTMHPPYNVARVGGAVVGFVVFNVLVELICQRMSRRRPELTKWPRMAWQPVVWLTTWTAGVVIAIGKVEDAWTVIIGGVALVSLYVAVVIRHARRSS